MPRKAYSYRIDESKKKTASSNTVVFCPPKDSKFGINCHDIMVGTISVVSCYSFHSELNVLI